MWTSSALHTLTPWLLPFGSISDNAIQDTGLVHLAQRMATANNTITSLGCRGAWVWPRQTRKALLIAHSCVPTGNMISDVGALALRSILGRSQVVLALEYVY